MKIIQLLAAIDGEMPGAIGSQIYGLGDDGSVYELVSPWSPKAQNSRGNYIPDPEAKLDMFNGKTVFLAPGYTGGWKIVATSDERSEIIKHPLES